MKPMHVITVAFQSTLGRLVLAGVLVLPWTRAQAQIEIGVSPLAGAPGQTLRATLSVNPATGIAGGDLCLQLPEFAIPGNVILTSEMADFLVASRARPGQLTISFAGPNGVAAGQSLIFHFPISLEAQAPAGLYPLSLDYAILYNDVPQAAPSPALLGSLTIQAPSADQDQDGLPDDWETSRFGNTTENAETDSDRDGASNYQELIAGTDPASADSVFQVRELDRFTQTGQSQFRLVWEGQEDRAYEIYWSDDPLGPAMVWHQVYNPDIHNIETSYYWIDNGTRTYQPPDNVRCRFYRILAVRH